MLLGARTAAAAALQASIKDQHGKPVADAVVSATPLDPKNALRAKQIDDALMPAPKSS